MNAAVEIALSLEQPPEDAPIVEHQPVELWCDAPGGAQLALAIDGIALDPFLRPGDSAWRWRWNPAAAVGLHQLALTTTWPGGESARRNWTLRVAPRKVDQERYEALLIDLQRVAYGILYTLAGASAEGAALQRDPPWQSDPIEEYYGLFAQRFEGFARAVGRIAARPREHLRGAEEQLPLGRAAALGPDALARLPRGDFDEAPAGVAQDLQEALRPGGGLLPRTVVATRGEPTPDIYEHRLLKHLLGLLLRRARFIGGLAERELARFEANEALGVSGGARRARVSEIAGGCASVARRLADLRAAPFLADVRPLDAFRGATPLLRRDAAYAEVYRMWMALRQRPIVAFDSPLFYLPIADLPRLYEIWCAIQVVRALLAGGGLVREQRIVERRGEDADGLDFAIGLVERAPLLVIERGPLTLTLRYQPRYRPLAQAEAAGARRAARLGSLDRHVRVPDLAIELRRPGDPPRVLLLDAKYRLDADGRGVPQDALADAYAYLGAIGYAGERATVGALLLYPGAGAAELYPSGVGSAPLLPAQTAALDAALEAQFSLSWRV